LRDQYKKAHWQTSGVTFYELHLLFDRHLGEQAELMDALAERVQTLGGLPRSRDVYVAGGRRNARVTLRRSSG
jgi:starvation-inducible DNA-binding protein